MPLFGLNGGFDLRHVWFWVGVCVGLSWIDAVSFFSNEKTGCVRRKDFFSDLDFWERYLCMCVCVFFFLNCMLLLY